MNRVHPYRFQIIAAFIVIRLLLLPTASATILYVGPNETYDNIKWALSQANDGDTIIVKDGVYLQDIKVDKSVVLMSENRHGAVIGDSSEVVARISISRASVDSVVIDGFKIVDGDLAGIVVGDGKPDHAPKNCIIRNNLIQNRSRGIRVDGTSNNLVISGNTISGCLESAIIHSGTGENMIAENIRENCGEIGIWLQEQQSGSFTISGNTIRKNAGNGIEINRSDVLMKSNIIERNHIGINTSSGQKDIIVSDTNQIAKNSSHGIVIETGTHVTVDKSIISQNGEEGIRNHGISVISGNSIDNNHGYGIWVLSGSSTITGNEISYNEIHGIEVAQEAENVVVNENTIQKNRMVGVMTWTGLVMKGNFIDSNGDHGILLAPSADSVKITDQNIVSNNGFHEILVDSAASALIRNNVIESDTAVSGENNVFHGIVIYGSANVDGNTIRNIRGSGVYVNESAGDVVITGQNQITGNLTGISLTGPAIVKNNHISGNSERGLWIGSPANNVEVSWNRIEENNTGVAVLSGTTGIALYNNTISNNARGLFSAGEPKLRSNTIQSNVNYGIKIRYEGIDMGDATSADSGKNAILDNVEWNVINDTPSEIDAFYNYWGTNNPDSIDVTIKDDNEDSLTGPVIFEPFLQDYNVGIDKYSIPSTGIGNRDPLSIYPNPVKGEMVTHIHLSSPAKVFLYIINSTGRIERSLVGGKLYEAGSSKIVWDGRAGDGRIVPDGVYFAVMRFGGHSFTRKIVVVR